ncbi:tumor necrosis factor ligand superfamily member 10 [Pristis pectinata]|uniref:tumor necrosis factor ligand superfamily member 10 n=1 Tax=Pristis pectinata TaxID=685728 RepID=UPI00223CCCEB|nr:tumor necrosis factor ligand superfamily member 10 [Pristis pectinata]
MGSSNDLVTARRLGCLLVSLLTLQGLCFTVTYLHFSHKLKQIEEIFSKNNMHCLTGDILNPPPDSMEDEDLDSGQSREQAESSEELCWRFRGQIQQLMQETISKQYEQDMSLIVKGEVSRFLPYLSQSGSGSQPPAQKIAAHLIGSHRTKAVSLKGTSSRKLQGQKIQAWEPSKGLAFLHNVKYTNGELIVPQTGLYYVYGQTYFRHRDMAFEEGSSTGDLLSDARNKQMAQYIYKTTAYPEPILLMKHTRTTCWARNAEYGLHSIYQGGIFELRYQDRIFVTVSNISLIDMAGGSSFFGAFLVS